MSDSRWKKATRHRTQKALDKKRTISGSFKKKRPQKLVTEAKFRTYRWGDEEEDQTFRVRDPLVRTDFFIIPQEPEFEHYFAGLDPLLYGNREASHGGWQGQQDEAAPEEQGETEQRRKSPRKPERERAAPAEPAEEAEAEAEAEAESETTAPAPAEVAQKKAIKPSANALTSTVLQKLKSSKKVPSAKKGSVKKPATKSRSHTRFDDDDDE
eukprot:TRINITY_DN11987_c0_g1_i1.p1 TRINITY_DN11987_c0_g1~~TRINITY_DN11987_c0_g1_i1.p1  ORF type:complete len:212 (+),score=82.62 TRINITY_DN11987_c0_g1_i1:83-718(+)